MESKSPGLTRLFETAAEEHRAGDLEAAERGYKMVLQSEPHHVDAMHMLASLSGKTPENAPLDHVSKLFADYATNFEKHLVRDLDYSMPKLIENEIRKVTSKEMQFANTY